MFQVYLPIAEISVNFFTIVGMGAAVGLLSGMFGVGGGFLITPLLIFSGVPPAVAVGTGVNQVVGASVTGAIAQYRRGNVDLRMGSVLLAGGFVGAAIGVGLFRLLHRFGQVDLIISLSYIVFLGIVGTFMLAESVSALRMARRPAGVGARRNHHSWIHGLPLKMRFPRSKLYISAIPAFVIGMVAGALSAVMGVGGGFLMVPAMIYLLRIPTNVVVGTSLFQIIFVASGVAIMHAALTHSVDAVLATLLMLGGVMGAQYGASAGRRLRGEQLRALLALIVLAVCGRLLFHLVHTPAERFSVLPYVIGH